MRLALQALERPKLEPFVPAKTAKQPFPITTYCTPSALGSQAGLPYLSVAPSTRAIRPCRHPAMAANARAMAARPTARLPMLLHRTHVLGRMCVHCVPLSASPKTPEVPNAVQCASCEFQYACFPTTSAVSRSRLND